MILYGILGARRRQYDTMRGQGVAEGEVDQEV